MWPWVPCKKHTVTYPHLTVGVRFQILGTTSTCPFCQAFTYFALSAMDEAEPPTEEEGDLRPPHPSPPEN